MKVINSLKMMFTSAMVIGGVIVAQDVENQLVAKDETNSEIVLEQVDNATKAQDFLELYEINTASAKDAKIITDTELFSEPSKSSETLGSLPSGTVLKSFKVFAREQMWAVEYNGIYGFVPLTSLMQVKINNHIPRAVMYDNPPKLKYSPKLKYPDAAKKMNIEGRVVALIHIETDGTVSDYKIIKSIPELDDAAIEVIKGLKFKPATYKGSPVDVWTRFPISFGLR